MSKNSKILLGILSILPFILVIISFSGFFKIMPEFMDLAAQNAEPDPMIIFSTFSKFMIPLVFAGLLGLVCMVVFIVHIAQDKSATSNDRVLWILLMVFFGQIVFPIYWYVRIWNQHSIDESPKNELNS